MTLRRAAIVTGGVLATGLAGAGGVYRWRLNQNKRVSADQVNKQLSEKDLDRAVGMLRRSSNLNLDANSFIAKWPCQLQLYRFSTCPFCGMAKAFLDYVGIPHQCVEVEPMFKSELRGFSYKKVPLAVIKRPMPTGETTQLELADSEAIVSLLSRHWDKKWAKQVEDPSIQEWRSWCRTELVRYLVCCLNKSFVDAWKGFSYIDTVDSVPLGNKIFLKMMGAPVMYMVANYMTKPSLIRQGLVNEGDDLHTKLFEALAKYQKACQTTRKKKEVYFHGGDEPDLADLDVYGALQSIRGHELYDDIMLHSTLRPWLDSMDKLTGKKPYAPRGEPSK